MLCAMTREGFISSRLRVYVNNYLAKLIVNAFCSEYIQKYCEHKPYNRYTYIGTNTHTHVIQYNSALFKV